MLQPGEKGPNGYFSRKEEEEEEDPEWADFSVDDITKDNESASKWGLTMIQDKNELKASVGIPIQKKEDEEKVEQKIEPTEPQKKEEPTPPQPKEEIPKKKESQNKKQNESPHPEQIEKVIKDQITVNSKMQEVFKH